MKKKFAPIAYLVPILFLAAILGFQLLPAADSVAGDKEGKTCSEAKACGKDCKAWHEKKLAKFEAMNERLNSLVAKMEEANGDEKVEAMAAVINELVAQRTEMHKRHANWKKYKGCSKRGEGKDSACSECADKKKDGGAGDE